MMIVKIMSSENLPDDDPRKSYSLYGNISGVSWNRDLSGKVKARMYVRDDVKTASVPGFSEHEVFADVPANAYVMNDRGKTVDTFCANVPEEMTDLGRPSPIRR